MKSKTIQLVTLTPLLKGSDIDRHKMLSYIRSKDKYYVFYVSEFKKKFNLKPGKIRVILKQFEKDKILIKIKSYPVFWKRVKE